MRPMLGEKQMNVEAIEKCDPPSLIKLVGRPKEKRIRSVRESRKGQSSGKLSKKGVVIICHLKGHNRAKCPYKKDEDRIFNLY